MKKLIFSLIILLMVSLISVPAYAANTPAIVNAYQVNIVAMVIHNSTTGKWYMLNAAQQNIDFNIPFTDMQQNWLSSRQLTAGTYDKVAFCITSQVSFSASYTDGSGTYNTGDLNHLMIGGLVTANVGPTPYTDTTGFTAPTIDYANAVKANRVTSYVPNTAGGLEIIQNINLTLGANSSISVMWDTTNCVQVDPTTEAGGLITITGLSVPHITVNVQS
ncbi:MAG: hypothetical protein P4N41_13420 [Negativicutes bacterium]|nr:hypothetical protein [Negativicutes bacterium]MDR3590646.1 hypothetical protein [Negativicutes bacterium]